VWLIVVLIKLNLTAGLWSTCGDKWR